MFRGKPRMLRQTFTPGWINNPPRRTARGNRREEKLLTEPEAALAAVARTFHGPLGSTTRHLEVEVYCRRSSLRGDLRFRQPCGCARHRLNGWLLLSFV